MPYTWGAGGGLWVGFKRLMQNFACVCVFLRRGSNIFKRFQRHHRWRNCSPLTTIVLGKLKAVRQARSAPFSDISSFTRPVFEHLLWALLWVLGIQWWAKIAKILLSYLILLEGDPQLTVIISNSFRSYEKNIAGQCDSDWGWGEPRQIGLSRKTSLRRQHVSRHLNEMGRYGEIAHLAEGRASQSPEVLSRKRMDNSVAAVQWARGREVQRKLESIRAKSCRVLLRSLAFQGFKQVSIMLWFLFLKCSGRSKGNRLKRNKIIIRKNS